MPVIENLKTQILKTKLLIDTHANIHKHSHTNRYTQTDTQTLQTYTTYTHINTHINRKQKHILSTI